MCQPLIYSLLSRIPSATQYSTSDSMPLSTVASLSSRTGRALALSIKIQESTPQRTLHTVQPHTRQSTRYTYRKKNPWSMHTTVHTRHEHTTHVPRARRTSTTHSHTHETTDSDRQRADIRSRIHADMQTAHMLTYLLTYLLTSSSRRVTDDWTVTRHVMLTVQP